MSDKNVFLRNLTKPQTATIYEAQRDLHQILLKLGYRGNDLFKLLDAIREWIKNKNIPFGATQENPKGYPFITNEIKYALARSLADEIVQKLPLVVTKNDTGIKAEIMGCLFVGDFKQETNIPIIEDFNFCDTN